MAVFEYVDAVCKVQHFLQAVGDEDDAVAFFLHQTDLLEQDLHLIIGQDCGRFVQEDQRAVVGGLGNDIQHFGDLDHLAHREGHIADLL